ncbi:MAG: hypothetical protein Q8R39_00325 [bacterium]|nr:hypothetical protein [bacterium]MDZ4284678.1 hypothetical protein [Patescibacteria group bacterium]
MSGTSGTAFSLNQFAEINARVTQALPKALADHDPKAVLAALEGRGEVLTRHLHEAFRSLLVDSIPERPKVLGPATEVSVGPLVEAFDPRIFFQTREGLNVWGDLKRMLRSATIEQPTDAMVLKRRALLRSAYDSEIKAELPMDYEVPPWVIAELIEAQREGQDGSLPTDGSVAIFYTPGYSMRVYWHRASRQWMVCVWWHPGSGRLIEDHLVFSHN